MVGDSWIASAVRPLARGMVAGLEKAIRITLPDGSSVEGGRGPVRATVRVATWSALARFLLDPELEFGAAYESGEIAVDGDLVALCEAAFDPRRPITLPSALAAVARRVAGRLPRRNGLAEARENIARHYDLGTDFYELWLDRELVYTCAYYRSRHDGLEEAQLAKLDHVCRKLDLRPGERVLEAGCGWGALALHMARRRGVSVVACNISRDQIAHARRRARAEGLEDRVSFVEEDWRSLDGEFDAFVAVGMLEHVGRENYEELGRAIDRTLVPEGRGLLHFIGRNVECETAAWLEQRIFPGAYMPTLRESLRVLEPRGFSVLDVENLRLHYALTLEAWLERFDRSRDRVEQRFGQAFVRAWRLYLASSLASFRAGSCQLFQVLFARATKNDLPLTREHLYARDGAPAAWTAATS
jgi:cyclopropane-fatty-acyl-phospholipid synthase